MYGIDVDPDDERLAIASAALETVSQTTGRSIVETLPFLRYVPSWFPGAGFQKEFAKSKHANHRLKNELFDEARAAIVRISISFDRCPDTHRKLGARRATFMCRRRTAGKEAEIHL